MEWFPVFLNLRNRLVLIVGGGEVATRKGLAMREAGARLRVVAPTIATELAAAATECHRRPAAADDLASDVDLVVLATDAPEAQADLQRLARERRIWCNRCDEPETSDFTTGSVCEQPPVVAAVMSSGCPGLSRLLKQRIAGVITPAVADLARLLVEVRPRVKARFPTQQERAAFFRRWTTEDVVRRAETEGLAALREELLAALT